MWGNDWSNTENSDKYGLFGGTGFEAPVAKEIATESIEKVKKSKSGDYDYDLIVVGGGSGGLSCAKTASELGAAVACFDFVKPSSHGTKWGIGGTCVNVGCIPKKIMHFTGQLRRSIFAAREMGYDVPKDDEVNFKWEKMIQVIGNHIKSLNYGYESQLNEKEVNYINAAANLVDPHTVQYWDKSGQGVNLTAEYIVLATGGRPWVPEIPGIHLAITSDDIFWKQTSPGKTLLVGASYIALETAGFLHEMGFETHVMVRSILLRGFDRECAEKIGTYLEKNGLIFHNKCTPQSLEKMEDGKILVTFKKNNGKGEEPSICQDVYDTVMYATGRRADSVGLGLGNAGIKLANNGKIDCINEATNVPNIYAIGDIVNGRQELTPVAIQAGLLLAKRLFGNSNLQMDYDNVPTTVFTPLEYGVVGISEEEAIKRHGEDDLEIYHACFETLESQVSHKLNEFWEPLVKAPHFAKLICLKTQNERILGFHFLGPNAGEVTQGFALAIKLGATKSDFDNVVGIHPTAAETFTSMHITKRSGESAVLTAC